MAKALIDELEKLELGDLVGPGLRMRSVCIDRQGYNQLKKEALGDS